LEGIDRYHDLVLPALVRNDGSDPAAFNGPRERAARHRQMRSKNQGAGDTQTDALVRNHIKDTDDRQIDTSRYGFKVIMRRVAGKERDLSSGISQSQQSVTVIRVETRPRLRLSDFAEI